MSRLLQFAHHLNLVLDYITSELFQAACLACGRSSSSAVCKDCFELPLVDDPKGTDVFSPRSALWFEEPWREVLHRIKFQRHRALLRLFKPAIAVTDWSFVVEPVHVVPVPVHYRTFRQRGFNVTETLARWIAKRQGWKLSSDALRKTRYTLPQSTLGKKERQNAVHGSFHWGGSTTTDAILLVDDVLTTGNTLQACAFAAELGGIKRVYSWTLFRAGAVGDVYAAKNLEIRSPEGTLALRTLLPRWTFHASGSGKTNDTCKAAFAVVQTERQRKDRTQLSYMTRVI